MFNVKLESFDAASKPKIIREVKAMIPNLTLIDVRIRLNTLSLYVAEHVNTGKEVRRVATKSSQGERRQGGRREAQESFHRPWWCRGSRVILDF